MHFCIFCEEKIEFMIVGAYALAVYGFPRATGGIDLWIRCSDANSQRVFRSLALSGALLSGLTLDDLKTPGIVFQVGVAPRRIDILTSIDGVEFDIARECRKKIEIEGLQIPIISRAHLLQSKIKRFQDDQKIRLMSLGLKGIKIQRIRRLWNFFYV